MQRTLRAPRFACALVPLMPKPLGDTNMQHPSRFRILLVATLAAAACRPGSLAPLTSAASLMSMPVGEDSLIPDPLHPGAYLLRAPITRLICQPEKYHGRRVQVSGFITLEFEGNRTCIGSDSDSLECIWLDVDGASDPGFRKARGLVEGTFDAELRGHFGCCSGTVSGITRIAKY